MHNKLSKHAKIENLHVPEQVSVLGVDDELSCEIRGAKANRMSGRVLTAAKITSHNTFDNPEVVKPSAFGGYRKMPNGFKATLPAKSIVVFEIE